MSNKSSAVKALVFTFFLFGISLPQDLKAAQSIPEVSIGQEAPDFKLESLDGKTVKLSDYKGKKVIVNFWASWCPSCRDEIPVLNKFFTDFGDDVQILAINIDPIENLSVFVKERQILYPVLLDKKGDASQAYGLLVVPTAFFIDEKGIIRRKYTGIPPADILREYSGIK